MSAAGWFARILNFQYVIPGTLTALLLISTSPGKAEPTPREEPSAILPALGGDSGVPTMDELRVHAATITDILKTASERVDQLAATDADAPALVDAIRQELSLSRRWNRHLGAILLDVAEARQALNTREREAAKEITRLTAAAEEARLELMALKDVLKGRPEEGISGEIRSEGRLQGKESRLDTDVQMAPNLVISGGLPEGPNSFRRSTIEETHAMLASVQAAEKSLARDVDAVRAKIVEALQTLATVRGDLPIRGDDIDAALSSEDITAWAASMATRLNRPSKAEAD